MLANGKPKRLLNLREQEHWFVCSRVCAVIYLSHVCPSSSGLVPQLETTETFLWSLPPAAPLAGFVVYFLLVPFKKTPFIPEDGFVVFIY